MISNRIYHTPIRVKKLIFNASIRCLLLYHYTPLIEEGLTSINKIDKLEAILLKQFLKIPCDVKGHFIEKICNWNKRKALDVIQKILANRSAHNVIEDPAADPPINIFT